MQAEFEASREALPQAWADYLPQVSASYDWVEADRDIKASATLNLGNYDVPARNWELSITQPIYRKQPLVKIDQAKLSIEQAQLGLLVAEQDLIMRVATGYLNVLAARDALELARAEQESTEKQYQLALENQQRGLGTMTQLSDTLGRYKLTQARVIEAEDHLEAEKLALKEIVGVTVSSIRGFKADFNASAPVPAYVEPWVVAAIEQNLVLQTRELASQIAQLEIKRQRAGHHPTVDFVASIGSSDTKSMVISGRDEESDYEQVALKFNMPLYSGGRTSSLIREASARLLKSEQEQEDERRRVERITRSTFMRIQSTTEMLSALRQVVSAQEDALQARLKGYKSGVVTAIDVLDAQRLYYSARRDYLQSRYDYLINRLKLKQSVGTLSRGDLEDLDALLN